MTRKGRWIGLGLLAGGCATVPTDAGFGHVRAVVADRIGHTVQWRGRTADDAAADRAVADLLGRPMGVEDAVQVALLNNLELQATYQSLGVAQADLVQAGLLTNPSFFFQRRLPGQALEADLDFNFLELFILPLRKRVAETEFRAAQARVTAAVIDTAADVRVAYFTYQADVQTLEMRRTVLAAADAGVDAVRRLHAAGNINELERDIQIGLSTQARLDLAVAEAQAVQDRERLNVLMGAWGGQTAWTVPDRLPEVPPAMPAGSGLETYAIAHRQDLVGVTVDVENAARALGYTDGTRFITDAIITVHYEHETNSDYSVGPSIGFSVPVFDQGQARVARGRDLLRQAQFRLSAAAVRVRSDVRAAYARVVAAANRATFFRQTVLPLQAKILAGTQLQYNGMFLGVSQLLLARQAQIDAGRAYIESVRDYWVARSELEKAVGGRLPGTAAGAPPPPTTQPNLPVPGMGPMNDMNGMKGM